MPKENVEKSTKNHRRSGGREERRPEAKKSKKSGGKSDDLRKDHQPGALDSEIVPVGDSMLTKAEDQLPEASPDASSNTIGRVKVSKKRKRSDRNSTKTANVEADTKPQSAEDWMDPAVDESLSEQSRKALSYAFEQCQGNEAWKFNKARQNWLLRNVWSEQAVPEKYISLVIKYLVSIQGGARKKLIEQCASKMSTAEQSAQPADQTTNDKSHDSCALRALSLFHTLQNGN